MSSGYVMIKKKKESKNETNTKQFFDQQDQAAKGDIQFTSITSAGYIRVLSRNSDQFPEHTLSNKKQENGQVDSISSFCQYNILVNWSP